MRPFRIVVCALLILNSPLFSPAQSATPATSSQALQFLQRSLTALGGAQSIADVTLTGTARRIAGSDDESGSATLKALATGATRIDLSFASGPRSEILNSTAAQPAGSWSGPDASAHPISFHNLLTSPFWFFPAYALAASSSAPGAQVTYLGHETHNGQAVEHLTITQSAPFADPPGAPTYAHLTQLDFFLDSTTLLPAALDFNIHPDNNALLDIPVEIQFSSYTTVNGVQLPFHIQKFINNTLSLDLQLQSATLNSGLNANSFTTQ